MGRIVKGKHSAQDTAFKVHYFPDISVSYPADGGSEAPPDETFERSTFGGDPNANGAPGSPSSESVQLPEEIRKKAAEIEAQAYIKGFTEGKEAGVLEGGKHFNQALDDMISFQETLYQNAQKNVAQLALSIAKKIILRETRIHNDIFADILKTALENIAQQEKIRVRLNPADLLHLQTNHTAGVSDSMTSDRIRFEPDDTVSPGGCIIQTSLGDIDARIERQIECVEDAFNKIFTQKT